MTPDDPIVDETRGAGQSYVDSFNGDWSALVADLRRRAQAEGRKPINLPPRAVRKSTLPANTAKKLG